MEQEVVIKTDEEQRLVYGEVYAPNRPDSQGDWMTKEEIRKMAHAFMRQSQTEMSDVEHDNVVRKGVHVVESYIAPDDDKVFIPGSWVVGVHVPDDETWTAIKKGEINGFSMEALVDGHPGEVDVEIPPVVSGTTSVSKGEDYESHQHKFYVTYENGQFKGGRTDVVNGHMHQIVAGTHTQPAKDGHTHRFSAVDDVQVVAQ